MKRNRRLIFLGTILLVLVFVVTILMGACGGPTTEYITTGSSHGEDPPAVRMIAIGRLWEEHLGIPVLFNALAGGPLTESPMLVEGALDFYNNTTFRDLGHAYRGTAEYQDIGKLDIRLFLHTTPVAIAYVTPRKDVTGIEDLNGKRVSFKSRRAISLPEVGGAILEYYGIRDSVVDIPEMGMKEIHAGLAEGKLDARSIGLMQWLSLKETIPGLKILNISKECGDYVTSKYPYVHWEMLPEGYKGTPPGTVGMVMPMGIACRKDLSEDLVYECVSIIYENIDELMAVHPTMEYLALDNVVTPHTTIPYHPGVVRYFKEKGVWSSEVDAVQKRLLAEF